MAHISFSQMTKGAGCTGESDMSVEFYAGGEEAGDKTHHLASQMLVLFPLIEHLIIAAERNPAGSQNFPAMDALGISPLGVGDLRGLLGGGGGEGKPTPEFGDSREPQEPVETPVWHCRKRLGSAWTSLEPLPNLR